MPKGDARAHAHELHEHSLALRVKTREATAVVVDAATHPIAAAAHPKRAARGVLSLLGASLASGVETVYWRGIHNVPYDSHAWRALRFAAQCVFSPVIRFAFSAISCFNHRVSGIEVRSIHWFPYDPVAVVNADP